MRILRSATLLSALLGCLGAQGAERITFAEVRTTALGRSLPLAVVAPSPRHRGRDTPVLFFLHGRGRHHRSLLESEKTRAALLVAPFFVVLLQGEDGWYVDSPARPADRYETYLEEVIAWTRTNLPVAAGRELRGIGGWSMGGYGAVRFAQRHARQFGFVGAVIGLLDFPRPETLPEGQNYRVPSERFTADPAIWRQMNPIHGVTALRNMNITLVLATRGFERTMNENFIAALAAEKIPARVHWLEGGHTFDVVERALPLVLADAAKAFDAAIGPPRPAAAGGGEP